MITRRDILAHLEAQVRTGFLKGVKGYQPLRRGWVREAPSAAAFELYTDMGDPPWPTLVEGKQGAGGSDARTGARVVNQLGPTQPIRLVSGEERSLMVYNLDWHVAVPIKHNAINDDRVGDLESWARGAGVNFQKHMDYMCFSALNDGGTTNYTYGYCYDGLSFFNDSHVDPGAEYQTAQDNKYALALSLTNFETVKVAASALKESRGQPLGLTHNLLIVPPALYRTATQISGNTEDYETANRAINPYSGKVRVLEAPGGWLDATAWYVIDETQVAKPILLQVREGPQLEQWDDFTQGSGVRYYRWVARYAVAYQDWRLAVEGNT